MEATSGKQSNSSDGFDSVSEEPRPNQGTGMDGIFLFYILYSVWEGRLTSSSVSIGETRR